MTTTITEKLQEELGGSTAGHEKTDSQSDAPTLHEPDQDGVDRAPGDGTPKDEEKEWVGGWKLASLMISITLAAFLMLLDMSIIVTVSGRFVVIHRVLDLTRIQAIPQITSDFHSLQDIGWYGSSYNLARYVYSFSKSMTIANLY
jgi:hypothetical protein